MLAEIKGITVSKGAIRCLGIYIGHDKIECYNKNWMKVSHDIDTLFESWKKRKLTLFGKCTVTNSLAISKLVYLANILELPDENYIKKINRLIFNFIWNKTDRIKRNTMIGKIEDGGMGITDIESKFKALKASWVRKLENTDHCILSYLNSYVPKNIDFNYLAMTSEKRIENFEIIQAMPLFYKQVFTCFNACKNINDKLNIVHFIKQPIWSNEKFSYRGKSIYFPNWLKSNILYVKDLFTDNGVLKTPEDIMRILVNKNNWICEYKIIKSIFKRYEKKFDLTIIKHLTGGKLKSQPLNKHTTKDFYNIFVKKKFQVPIMQTKYKKEFNIAKSDWEKIYLNKEGRMVGISCSNQIKF